MKKYITKATLLLATTLTAVAHPGPPGHTHTEGEWPFPDIKWSIVIAALCIISFTAYKLRKKT